MTIFKLFITTLELITISITATATNFHITKSIKIPITHSDLNSVMFDVEFVMTES